MSRNFLLEAGAKSKDEVTATGLEPRATYWATMECGFTLKRVRDMIRTCNQS